jgi:alpha,alpha-trehalose-phosphate synthase [UDP-forming]
METGQRDANFRPRMSGRVLLDERILPARFLVVSNRLPYQITLEGDGVRTTRGVGGLVTALDPIVKRVGGTWIGWSGSYDDLPEAVTVPGAERDYNLRVVSLTPDEVEGFYLGYSNKGLWPLFHYFQEYCEFSQKQWTVFRDVNRKFADAILREYREGDLIWIHDYHLMLVPGMLREALPEAQIGFFLHVPFPSAELFLVEPHARELVEGVVGADLVGFHIDTYARNFVNAVDMITGYSCKHDERTMLVGDRTVHVGRFPISIAFDNFEHRASGPEADARVAKIQDYYHADILAVGVDRLDYTKGIPERLQAIELMLERHPELQGKFTFVQISAPSRTKVEAYKEMREKVEQIVGRINGRFSGKGCIPVDYRYESYSQEDLGAYYRASHLGVVTPLRDGMNLVAKEYVASKIHGGGALVLSRFTGAYEELKSGAFIVNPYDLEGTAEEMYRAIVAPDDGKRIRMQRMRDTVRRNDIYWWLERFLRALS